ncbi:MAG: hypothetical protein EHM65_00275 [Acidobacteriales bacterium]|nr:MAG: hypothetical protein EHM65_00275 [Terriglobales bacterium]
MNSEKPSPVIRWFPSLTDVAFLMPLALLFLRMDGAQRMLGDGDTGWHIRTGEWILQNGRVPDKDMFSFTKAGEPWYAWEWLWDVVFAWLHIHFGMAAVVLASILVICFTFAILFRLVRSNCPNVIVAFGITFMATAGSTMHWLARPHLFTLLFVVIFCALLERARSGQTRWLLLLPALMILWTNLHGGFFVGILLIGCYAAGELVFWLVEQDRQQARAALARSKPFLFSALACAAATLFNPYSYRLHLHLYRYLGASSHLKYIDEFQPTNFRNSLALWLEPMALLGAVAILWCLYHKRFAHAILLAGWLHLALFAARNLPIFLIVAAPFVAGMAHEALLRLRHAPLAAWVGRTVKSLEDFAEDFGATDRFGRVHLTSALGFLAVGALFFTPAPTPKFRTEYDPKKYPAQALEVLRGAEFSRSIFTNDEWGDYLIYRSFPGTKVFIDGRSDFYGDDFLDKYIGVLKPKYTWEATLAEHGVDTILLPVGAPLVSTLKESHCWRPVYDDGMAIVFRSEIALARAGSPGLSQVPAAALGSRVSRGREAAKYSQRGPRTTKFNVRSESL